MKNSSLLRKVEAFEKMATYGDRSSFLKSLGEEPMGPGLFDDPDQVISGKPSVSEDIDTAPWAGKAKRMIDPKVQGSLNKLFELNLKLDGDLGPQTAQALQLYKNKYHDTRHIYDPSFQKDVILQGDISAIPAVASRVSIPLFDKLATPQIPFLRLAQDENKRNRYQAPKDQEIGNQQLNKVTDTGRSMINPAQPVAPKTNNPQQARSQPARSQPDRSQSDPMISRVQEALNKLQYPGRDGQPLKEDGVLGGNTQFAINNYVTKTGLKGDKNANYNAIIEAGERVGQNVDQKQEKEKAKPEEQSKEQDASKTAVPAALGQRLQKLKDMLFEPTFRAEVYKVGPQFYQWAVKFRTAPIPKDSIASVNTYMASLKLVANSLHGVAQNSGNKTITDVSSQFTNELRSIESEVQNLLPH